MTADAVSGCDAVWNSKTPSGVPFRYLEGLAVSVWQREPAHQDVSTPGSASLPICSLASREGPAIGVGEITGECAADGAAAGCALVHAVERINITTKNPRIAMHCSDRALSCRACGSRSCG